MMLARTEEREKLSKDTYVNSNFSALNYIVAIGERAFIQPLSQFKEFDLYWGAVFF